jgi:DnaJ like chaperone protein
MKRTLYTVVNSETKNNASQDFSRQMKQLVQKISSFLPTAAHALNAWGAADFSTGQSGIKKAPTDKAYLAYTQAVTALAAKLACVDGAANKAEFDAFSALFAFDGIDAHLLKRVFIKHAQEEADGFEQYARNLARMPICTMQREELLRRLSLLAASDGHLHPLEIESLRKITLMLGLNVTYWRNLLAPHLGLAQAKANPWRVLGISRRADANEIRTKYHQLARMMHPDQLAALHLSADTNALLHAHFRAVVAAYESLAKQRKL